MSEKSPTAERAVPAECETIVSPAARAELRSKGLHIISGNGKSTSTEAVQDGSFRSFGRKL